MGRKKFESDDKDKHRLKAQRDTIVKLQREVKVLEQQVRALEKALNRPPKEKTEKEKKKEEPKLTPEQEREAVRAKWAAWSKANAKKVEE